MRALVGCHDRAIVMTVCTLALHHATRTRQLTLPTACHPEPIISFSLSASVTADHRPFRDPRVTEQRNPRSVSIDLATPLEIVDIICAEDAGVVPALIAEREALARAITAAETALRNGGRIVYAGAGTSGRLGVLDASEIPPTFGADFGLVVGLIAGGTPALLRAQEGAEDSVQGGADDLDAVRIGVNDFFVGIAASGTTPYVHGALRRAKAVGATTGMIACTPLPPSILDAIDIPIVLIVGPEVVTGSTRMKSGTATKLALNIISTGAMIRIGKTFGNLMVDLRATNAKLVDRSERIVAEICGVEQAAASTLLSRADGSVKRAIVMQLLGVDAAAADAALASAHGVIRRTVNVEPPAISTGAR
jgi:N-acetylmuramic acid 6-phosphate etherase